MDHVFSVDVDERAAKRFARNSNSNFPKQTGKSSTRLECNTLAGRKGKGGAQLDQSDSTSTTDAPTFGSGGGRKSAPSKALRHFCASRRTGKYH